MPNQSDAQLLREYAVRREESAFAEIVSRHTDLVYSAALRQCGSPETAREISQTVFTDLARKAGELAARLGADASLAGWLYHGARYAVLNLRRDERRRANRAQTIMRHFETAVATPAENEWQRVAPVLDEAMAELNDAEREAIILRYFKNLDFAAVGRALGISDDAAQKRVSRAVERLRDLLQKRGVTVGAGGLVILVSTNAILIAPVGLSAAITAAAIAGTTLISATTTTVAFGKGVATSMMQKGLLAFALAILVGLGIQKALQVFDSNKLNRERAALETPVEQHQKGRNEASGLPTKSNAMNELLAAEQSEFLPLRDRVSQFKPELSKQPDPAIVPLRIGEHRRVEDFRNVGAETPEAAFESIIWAARNAPEQLTNLIYMPAQVRRDPERLASDPHALADYLKGVLFGSNGSWPELSIRDQHGPTLVELRSTKIADKYNVYDDVHTVRIWRFSADGQKSDCPYHFFFRQFPQRGWRWMIPDYSPSTAIEGLGGPIPSGDPSIP